MPPRSGSRGRWRRELSSRSRSSGAAASMRRPAGRSRAPRPRPKRSTQERRAGDGEAPRNLGGARDADSRAADDLRLGLAPTKLKGSLVEREAVVLACHAERLAEPAGAGAEEAQVVEAASSTHRLHPFDGLDRPQEHGRGDALLAADEVDAPVDAVRAVDVGVPGEAEHRRVARRPAAEAVARRILVVVRLDLDDRAADSADEERDAEEVGRDLLHRAGEEVLADHASGRLES